MIAFLHDHRRQPTVIKATRQMSAAAAESYRTGRPFLAALIAPVEPCSEETGEQEEMLAPAIVGFVQDGQLCVGVHSQEDMRTVLKWLVKVLS